MSDNMVNVCLKCGTFMKEWVSLCKKCLNEELVNMDKGIQTGYLYAAKEYIKKEKQLKQSTERLNGLNSCLEQLEKLGIIEGNRK